MSADEGLDELDQTIVDTLLVDGRMSVPALAEQVGCSRAAAYNRFDRLVDSGVIQGFGARVDPSAVGLGVAAVILLSAAEQSQWSTVNQVLLEIPGVQWVGLAAGSFDYVVLVRAHDLDELRDVVLGRLQELPGIGATQTAVLLDESRPEGSLL